MIANLHSKPTPTQLNVPVPQVNPIHKGGIKKGDPKYDEILKKAGKETDYGIGELMYKKGANAKKFIEEALNYIKQLDY